MQLKKVVSLLMVIAVLLTVDCYPDLLGCKDVDEVAPTSAASLTTITSQAPSNRVTSCTRSTGA